MSKKKDSLKPWLSRPTINRSVTLPLTRPLTQRLSNLNEFHPNELDPYLLFDARDSMIGTLENPTLDLDPSKPDTLNVITATRAGTATYTDANGLIAQAPANTVRVDHVDGVPMILVEPSATNLVTNSNSFSASGTAVKTTGFEAPDGTNNSTKISNIQDGDGEKAHCPLTSVSGSTQYSGSIYIKGTGGQTIRVQAKRATTGSFSGSGTQTITFDGTWQRVTNLTWTTASNNNDAFIVIKNEFGTTADEVYLWGGQIETGSVSTSVIPTSGSTAQRAADDLKITGSAFSNFYNQSEGTFYLEFEPRELSTSITNTAFELSNGTGAERILSHVDSQIHAYFVDGGNVQANLDGGTNTVGVLNRLAVSYKANNIQVSVSGGAVVSDTSASIPTVDRLIIGNQVDDTTRLLNGHIKRLIYWPYHSDNL